MKFSCTRDDLLYAVNNASRAVTVSTTLPVLECLLIEADDFGITITGNNLELGIKIRLNADVSVTGTVSVNAKRFSEIVKKLPDDEVVVEARDNNLINITCGYAIYDIVGVDYDEFPSLPEVDTNRYFTIKENVFKEMVRQTSLFVSLVDIKPILTGSYVEVNDGLITMVSCDGFRLAVRKDVVEEANGQIKCVVPGKTLREIASILSDNSGNVEIRLTDKHLLLKVNNVTLVSRLLEGEYINYEQIIPRDHQISVAVDRKSVTDSIERAAVVISENAKSPVVLNINEDNIRISCITANGDFKDVVPCSMRGNNLEIGFNCKFLLDALKSTDEDSIVMEFTSDLAPCLIKSVESDKYMFIILPVRLKK